jgi:hypothetical protein
MEVYLQLRTSSLELAKSVAGPSRDYGWFCGWIMIDGVLNFIMYIIGSFFPADELKLIKTSYMEEMNYL